MDVPPPPPLTSPTGQVPPRHGCLTAWLVFMIIVNALTAVMTPLSLLASANRAYLHLSPISTGIITLCALANILCAIALFRWQKWGFYGFIVTTVIALVVNLSVGVGVGSSLVGLIGIALLYWVLNMGEANKAWPRLR